MDYIKLLEKNGLLKVIEDELDIDLEIPHAAYVEVKQPNSKAILFKNPISKRLNKKFNTPVLMNVFGSYEATELIFGRKPDEIAKQIENLLHVKPPKSFKQKFNLFSELFKLKNLFPKRLKTKGKCQEVVFEKIDLNALPVLKTWSDDGGAFITMGQVYTQSLDGTKQNVGMYRLQVYDDKTLGMHWQIHKDGANFFHEYKQAGVKMPVSIAIGGDPLYIWCGQAPLPNGVFELLLYGLIRGKNARLVKSLTNDIYVPEDADFVIEGFVDTSKSKIEGPFGDHTGYYTLKEPYPVLDVSAITSKKEPIFAATVVGKPPLEDKYMGYATERIFLPLLKTTTPELIDYHMPENGVFHNLILAKLKTLYPAHAKQCMHAFWGVGQMSFVKHAIFVGENAPELNDFESLSEYILNRFDEKNILISEGVCDALDHASPNACFGGKLGVDCTGEIVQKNKKNIQNEQLYGKISALLSEARKIEQYFTHTSSPICVIGVDKKRSLRDVFNNLVSLKKYIKILIFVDEKQNDVKNPYMLVWRITNNIDAKRDIFIDDDFVIIDATNKNALDGFDRQWPDDVTCDGQIIKELNEKNIINTNKEFLKHYYV